jgi:hypothetical protein
LRCIDAYGKKPSHPLPTIKNNPDLKREPAAAMGVGSDDRSGIVSLIIIRNKILLGSTCEKSEKTA